MMIFLCIFARREALELVAITSKNHRSDIMQTGECLNSISITQLIEGILGKINILGMTTHEQSN